MHDCPEKYSGPSKSMETEENFQLVVDVYNVKNYTVGTIVSYDNTTMKTHLKHGFKELIKAG